MDLDPRVALALGWARTQDFAGYWREGDGGNRFGKPDQYGAVRYDCSGFQSMFGVMLGQKLFSIPVSSGSLAYWLDTTQLGNKCRLSVAKAKEIVGSYLIIGGYANGAEGHIVVNAGGGRTWESNGHNGVCQEDINQYVYSHAGIFPVMLDAWAAPVISPHEEETVRFIRGSAEPAVYRANASLTEKVWIVDPNMLSYNKQVAQSLGYGVDVIVYEQSFVNSIPLRGPKPPNYTGS